MVCSIARRNRARSLVIWVICVCCLICVCWVISDDMCGMVWCAWYVLYDVGWCLVVCAVWCDVWWYDVAEVILDSATQHAATRVATRCSATCSSTLQHKIVAQSFLLNTPAQHIIAHCSAMCCSTLQHNALQHTAAQHAQAAVRDATHSNPTWCYTAATQQHCNRLLWCLMQHVLVAVLVATPFATRVATGA